MRESILLVILLVIALIVVFLIICLGWYLVFNLLVNRFRFVRELFMIKEEDEDKQSSKKKA